MQLALFLHLYQPPTQFPEVLAQVVSQSYEPILTALENNPQVKITVNMSASLTEQLSLSYWSLLAKFRRLVERKQIELTGTAAYHPLLTEIPETEISRQIKINEDLNTRFWQVNSQKFRVAEGAGISRIKGFFPPEMAIDTHLLEIAKRAGYSYVLADETLLSPTDSSLLTEFSLFTDRTTGIKLVCRQKELSLDVAFSRVKTVSELLAKFKKVSNQPYLILAMDGETFGHHRPEQMAFLSSLFNLATANPDDPTAVEMVNLTDLIGRNSASPPITAQKSSWGESFARWQNPVNPVHVSQWRLLRLAVATIGEYPEVNDQFWQARGLLDKGLHSDQFWWASHSPCWHYQMIERGALLLLEAVTALDDVASPVREAKRQAEDLFGKITKTALALYGDTVVAC